MHKSVFWIEFIIMVGILLLVTEMTLLGVSKAHQMTIQNQRQIEALVQLQNLMEYCKMNQSHLKESLDILDKDAMQENWIILYNKDWEVVETTKEGMYLVEIHRNVIPYDYHTFQELTLGAYTLEDRALILELKGGICI